MINKEDILRKLLIEHRSGYLWIDSIPADIKDSFFDNPLVDSLHSQIKILMNAVFTEQECTEISIYLEKYELSGHNNGVYFKVNTDEELIDMMKVFYKWD